MQASALFTSAQRSGGMARQSGALLPATLWFALLLCGVGTAAWALPPADGRTAASVTGQVTDASGPVAGATVSITPADGSGRAAPVNTLSDVDGRFSISGVAAGEWTLNVRRLGYMPHTEPLALTDGQAAMVQVRLILVPQRLDTVAVVSDGVPERYGANSRMSTFYERRARGRGQFFAREQLDLVPNQRFYQFLSTTRGAKVRLEADGTVSATFARCSGPSTLQTGVGLMGIARGSSAQATPTAIVFLDGHKMGKETSRTLLGELRIEDVEAVEVYNGPAELPLEAMGDACAAIFVWTRFGPGVPPGIRADSVRRP